MCTAKQTTKQNPKRRRKREPLTKSESMARVRQKGTAPELRLRRCLWGLGLRYRLHAKDLPGTPDIVFRGAKVAVFVHGCFWHSHGCKLSLRKPVTNAEFWQAKLERNADRDRRCLAELTAIGWTPIVAWACEDLDVVAERIKKVQYFNTEAGPG
jgi:DNA mismatch endonuclease (patch repair protein)